MTKDDSSSLPPVLSPCDNVRRSCHLIMSEPSIEDGGNRTVCIDSNALQDLAQTISGKDNNKPVEWDTEKWHYNAENYKGQEKQERVALYILALDAINFCFWPHASLSSNTLEYHDLAMALTKLAQQDDDATCMDQYIFSPNNLANMTEQQFISLLEPLVHPHYLPNTSERVRLWNELGHGLLQMQMGAVEFIQQAHGNAPRLVSMLLSTFPGFRDCSLFLQNQVCFYKRAQIAVGDLNAALSLELLEMDKLTMFADYRVPQLLRHVGVLRYSPKLAQLVDSQQEIDANSPNELYIRAATVVAVERLVFKVMEQNAGSNNNNNITDVAMDWHLWQVGEELHKNGQMKPHHRTRTIFY